MENIERVYKFLKDADTYYLATVEGDQPRVRPFGTVLVFDGKLCIQTGRVKECSKQLAINPKAEICAFNKGEWIRVSGELVEYDSRAVREVMLNAYPSLRKMYNEDDGNTQVLYFRKGKAVFYSFTNPAETVEF